MYHFVTIFGNLPPLSEGFGKVSVMNWKLIKHNDPKRKRQWETRAWVKGKKISKFHMTREEAYNFIKRYKGKSGDQWFEIQSICNEYELDPLEAIKDYVREKFADKSKLLSDAVEECISYRKKRNITQDHNDHVSSFIRRFRDKHPNDMVYQFSTHRIEDWLLGETSQPTTFKNYKKYLSILFSFCKERGYIRENPVSKIKLLPEAEREIEILTVDEAEKLMLSNQDSFAPYLALQLFAGIRPSATWRMTPDMIDTTRKVIDIPAKAMKAKQRHFMENLPTNFWKWMELSKPDTWGKTERQLKKLKEQAFIKANVQSKNNVLRHSFCTYSCAMDQSVNKTAYMLAHQNPSMLYRHYKGIATQKDAKRFFNIVPK